jgi:hypothetical protein
VSKGLIKIITRNEGKAAADDKTLNSSESNTETPSEEKIERRLHRKMANTVSNWVAERRENRRSEEISAFRNLFGDELLSSGTI